MNSSYLIIRQILPETVQPLQDPQQFTVNLHVADQLEQEHQADYREDTTLDGTVLQLLAELDVVHQKQALVHYHQVYLYN